MIPKTHLIKLDELYVFKIADDDSTKDGLLYYTRFYSTSFEEKSFEPTVLSVNQYYYNLDEEMIFSIEIITDNQVEKVELFDNINSFGKFYGHSAVLNSYLLFNFNPNSICMYTVNTYSGCPTSLGLAFINGKLENEMIRLNNSIKF